MCLLSCTRDDAAEDDGCCCLPLGKGSEKQQPFPLNATTTQAAANSSDTAGDGGGTSGQRRSRKNVGGSRCYFQNGSHTVNVSEKGTLINSITRKASPGGTLTRLESIKAGGATWRGGLVRQFTPRTTPMTLPAAGKYRAMEDEEGGKKEEEEEAEEVGAVGEGRVDRGGQKEGEEEEGEEERRQQQQQQQRKDEPQQ